MAGYRIWIIIGMTVLNSSCDKNNNADPKAVFDSIPVSHMVQPMIIEASGIAPSNANPGHLWVHEDSGTPNQLFLVKSDGNVQKKIHLKGITNRDWEDMALVNNRVYIAETGDNGEVYTDYAFYHFAEPGLATDTVFSIDTIRFSYPDGSHDAEAFLVDKDLKFIYIITKRDNPSRIYKLSFPYTSVMQAEFLGVLPYTGVTSCTQSTDGKEIMVRTYTGIFYYNRLGSQSIPQAMANGFTSLKHKAEPQGEAICFSLDGSGFYTLSEKAFASQADLNYYKRN